MLSHLKKNRFGIMAFIVFGMPLATLFGAPVIDSASLTECLWRGGETVVLTGSGLSGTTLKFTDESAAEIPVSVLTHDSDTQITFETPAIPGTATGASAAMTLVVSNTNAESATFPFTFYPCIITAITPNLMTYNSSAQITLTGRGFTNPNVTRISLANSFHVTSFLSVEDTRITFRKQASQPTASYLGYYKDLKVQNAFGTAVLPKGFGWVGPNQTRYLSNVCNAADDQREIPIGADGLMKIRGAALWEAGARVELVRMGEQYGDWVSAEYSIAGTQLIVSTASITEPHLYKPTVKIQTSDGNTTDDPTTSGVIVRTFTPQLVRLGSTHGSEYGLETVLCEGFNLSGVDTVKFGDNIAGIIDKGPNYLRVLTPQGTAGSTVSVTVSQTSYPAFTLADAYTYDTGTGAPPFGTTPKIMFITPAVGSPSAANTAWICGYNLDTVYSVTFGNTACTIYSQWQGRNFIRVQTASSNPEGSVDVTVRDQAQQTDTLTDGYTFSTAPAPALPAPTLSVHEWDNPLYVLITNGEQPILFGADITSASVAGGETITLYGYKLENVLSVDFGSTRATTFGASATPSALEVMVPQSSIKGNVALTVTTTGGTTSPITFNYIGARVDSMSPARGPIAGGTLVSIKGAGFGDLNTTTVTFGNESEGWAAVAATLQSVSNEEIVLHTPSYPHAGIVDVIVTVDGIAATAQHFRYAAPEELVIFGLSPNTGNELGGEIVTITGQHLDKVVDVVFTIKSMAFPHRYQHATNLEHIDASTLRVTTPNHAYIPGYLKRDPALEDVIVADTFMERTLPAVHDILVDGYHYVANEEVIISITSPTGPISGWSLDSRGVWQPARFTAHGVLLDTIASVKIGDAPLITEFGSVTDTQFSCRLPANPTGRAETVDVTFTLTDGTERPFPASFQYVETVVEVNPLSPQSGNEIGGNTCNLSGSNLGAVTQVFFGDNEASILPRRTNADIQVLIPASTTGVGLVDLRLVLSNGMPDVVLSDAFTYLADIKPEVDSIYNATGPVSGGTTVTFIGQHLDLVTQVAFGGVSAQLNTNSQRDTALQAVAPPATTAGTVDVDLHFGNRTVSLAAAFTYSDSGFVVTGFSPNHGSSNGGTLVSLTGSGLLQVSEIDVDGIKVVPMPGGSDRLVYVSMPVHAVGTVTLQASDGTNTSIVGDFTYREVAGTSPNILGLTIASGKIAGGETLTIIGERLATVTSVTFGGVPVTRIVYAREQSIQIITPPALVAGPVDVTISNGVSGDTLFGGFTYRDSGNGETGGAETPVTPAVGLLSCSLAMGAMQVTPLLLLALLFGAMLIRRKGVFPVS